MVDDKEIIETLVYSGAMRCGKTFHVLESAQMYANRTGMPVLYVGKGQTTTIEPEIDSKPIQTPAFSILPNARIEPLPYIPSDNFSEQLYREMVREKSKVNQ